MFLCLRRSFRGIQRLFIGPRLKVVTDNFAFQLNLKIGLNPTTLSSKSDVIHLHDEPEGRIPCRFAPNGTESIKVLMRFQSDNQR